MLSRRCWHWKGFRPVRDARLTRWLLAVLLCGALCVACVAGSATAARADDGVVLTRQAYQNQLLQALAALRAASREPDDATRGGLIDLALSSLPARVQLAEPGGAVLDQRTLRYPVSELRHHLRTETAYWQSAEALLVQVGLDAGLTPEELAIAGRETAAPPALNQEAAARRLDADWRGAGRGKPAWLQQAMDKVAVWWDDLWNWLGRRTAGVSKPAQYVVMGVLAVALLIGAFFAIRLFERRRRPGRTAPAGEETAWVQATPGEALVRADQLAAAGEYTQALRWLHRAALGRLDAAGLIRFLPATTDWEYLVRLRTAPGGLREALQDLTDRYQRAFFGGHSPVAADYDQGRAVYLLLQATAAAGAPPATREAVTP